MVSVPSMAWKQDVKRGGLSSLGLDFFRDPPKTGQRDAGGTGHTPSSEAEGPTRKGPAICAKRGSPRANFSVGLTQTVRAPRHVKLPSPPPPNTTGSGVCLPAPSASPGRKLEMTQPEFLLLKWWGFLSGGSRPGQDHKWAALRAPPQARGPTGEARPGKAGQISRARPDMVSP